MRDSKLRLFWRALFIDEVELGQIRFRRPQFRRLGVVKRVGRHHCGGEIPAAVNFNVMSGCVSCTYLVYVVVE